MLLAAVKRNRYRLPNAARSCGYDMADVALFSIGDVVRWSLIWFEPHVSVRHSVSDHDTSMIHMVQRLACQHAQWWPFVC